MPPPFKNPPGRSKDKDGPQLRWIRVKSDETFPNGDPLFLYTLEFFNGKDWQAVPTFEKQKLKTVEIKTEAPAIVRSY